MAIRSHPLFIIPLIAVGAIAIWLLLIHRRGTHRKDSVVPRLNEYAPGSSPPSPIKPHKPEPTPTEDSEEEIWPKGIAADLDTQDEELQLPEFMPYSTAGPVVMESENTTQGTPVSRYCLDAAVPDQVYIGRAFDLAVKIRLPDTPTLEEPGLPTLRTGDVQLDWPEDQDFVRLRVGIRAPECKIEGPDTFTIRLHRGEDSPTVYFQLTPLKQGDLSIVVTVYQEEDWLGSARVRTVAQEQQVGQVQVVTQSYIFTGLPAALYRQFHAILLACGPFDSNQAMRMAFIDSRISMWRNVVPDADSPAARVDALIDALLNRFNTGGENALKLFIQALQSRVPYDRCHSDLAELETALTETQQISHQT